MVFFLLPNSSYDCNNSVKITDKKVCVSLSPCSAHSYPQTQAIQTGSLIKLNLIYNSKAQHSFRPKKVVKKMYSNRSANKKNLKKPKNIMSPIVFLYLKYK